MVVSENEASVTGCPVMRNLTQIPEGKNLCCVGKACMAWRWFGSTLTGGVFGKPKPDQIVKLGYCGLAGKLTQDE